MRIKLHWVLVSQAMFLLPLPSNTANFIWSCMKENEIFFFFPPQNLLLLLLLLLCFVFSPYSYRKDTLTEFPTGKKWTAWLTSALKVRNSSSLNWYLKLKWNKIASYRTAVAKRPIFSFCHKLRKPEKSVKNRSIFSVLSLVLIRSCYKPFTNHSSLTSVDYCGCKNISATLLKRFQTYILWSTSLRSLLNTTRKGAHHTSQSITNQHSTNASDRDDGQQRSQSLYSSFAQFQGYFNQCSDVFPLLMSLFLITASVLPSPMAQFRAELPKLSLKHTSNLTW